jgi:hypothetical protein
VGVVRDSRFWIGGICAGKASGGRGMEAILIKARPELFGNNPGLAIRERPRERLMPVQKPLVGPV